MTVPTREIIQDGIADPKNDDAHVKAFVLSHGTMEVYNLKDSRKFYEEFLGLECVRHAKPAIVVRLGLKFHIVAVEVGANVHPMNVLNHWGMDVKTKEEVDDAYEKALKYQDKYKIRQVLKPVLPARRLLVLHGGPGSQLVGDPALPGLPERRPVRFRRPLLDGRWCRDR